jgi:hypothetical protein
VVGSEFDQLHPWTAPGMDVEMRGAQWRSTVGEAAVAAGLVVDPQEHGSQAAGLRSTLAIAVNKDAISPSHPQKDPEPACP